MALNAQIRSVFNAVSGTNAVRIFTGAALVPASGAPGAYKTLLADAAVTTDYWVLGASFDTPSLAALFDYDISTPAAGTTVLAQIHFEVATDAGGYNPIYLPIPIKVIASATNGLGGRQLTASGQTCNMYAIYATGLNG